ncbi:hypothetical protein DL98DRAFT_535241 [Cadophora sp. DSE1049]|nr:hypothetical protein DL98DRAFT_535241 [Cadophora sp. DSE1049]
MRHRAAEHAYFDHYSIVKTTSPVHVYTFICAVSMLAAVDSYLGDDLADGAAGLKEAVHKCLVGKCLIIGNFGSATPTNRVLCTGAGLGASWWNVWIPSQGVPGQRAFMVYLCHDAWENGGVLRVGSQDKILLSMRELCDNAVFIPHRSRVDRGSGIRSGSDAMCEVVDNSGRTIWVTLDTKDEEGVWNPVRSWKFRGHAIRRAAMRLYQVSLTADSRICWGFVLNMPSIGLHITRKEKSPERRYEFGRAYGPSTGDEAEPIFVVNIPFPGKFELKYIGWDGTRRSGSATPQIPRISSPLPTIFIATSRGHLLPFAEHGLTVFHRTSSLENASSRQSRPPFYCLSKSMSFLEMTKLYLSGLDFSFGTELLLYEYFAILNMIHEQAPQWHGHELQARPQGRQVGIIAFSTTSGS